MKRTMKKLTALMMALVMVMSLVVTASAVNAPGCTLTDAGDTGVTAVAFAYKDGLDDDEKTALLAAIPTAGTTLTVTGSGDTAWDTVTASASVSGYTFTGAFTGSNPTVTIKKGTDEIGTITITFPDDGANGTIKIKLTGTKEGPAGDDVLTEADADNSEDAISGAGTYEGYVDKEVFRVTLPTVTADDIAFTIDPQGLIAATAAAAKDGKKFTEAGSMFFLNTNDKVKVKEGSDDDADYSPNTDKFKVVNKGATAVDVELTVSASGTALGATPTISFVEDTEDFTGSEDTSLYIALNTKGTGDEAAMVTPIALDGTEYKATATASIDATDGVYEYQYDEDESEYIYALKEGAEGFKELEFWLSGAANTNAIGDWGLTTGSLALALTWKITKVESGGSGPRVTAEPVAALTRNMEITLNVANAVGYELKSVTYGDADSPTELSIDMTEVGVDGTATITFIVDRGMVGAAPTTVNVIFTNTETEADTPPKTVTIVAAE